MAFIKCKYCGIKRLKGGANCRKSPHKYCEVDIGPKHCIYCGNPRNRPGANCKKSPHGSCVLGT